MSLSAALQQCFDGDPARVFGVQDLCRSARRYYPVSPFQEEPDPLHGQSRYAHSVRSNLNRLKRQGTIVRLGRDEWRLARE